MVTKHLSSALSRRFQLCIVAYGRLFRSWVCLLLHRRLLPNLTALPVEEPQDGHPRTEQRRGYRHANDNGLIFSGTN